MKQTHNYALSDKVNEEMVDILTLIRGSSTTLKEVSYLLPNNLDIEMRKVNQIPNFWDYEVFAENDEVNLLLFVDKRVF